MVHCLDLQLRCLAIILEFFFSLLAVIHGLWDLFLHLPPPPREWNPSPSAVTVASPNHWTTRELSSEIGSETLVRGVTQEGELTEWMVGLEI